MDKFRKKEEEEEGREEVTQRTQTVGQQAEQKKEEVKEELKVEQTDAVTTGQRPVEEQPRQSAKPQEQELAKEKRGFSLFDVFRYRTIKEEDIRDVLEELKEELLESDVSFEVTEKIAEDIKNALVGKKVSRGEDLEKLVEDTLRESIKKILEKNFKKIDLIEEIRRSPSKPYVIVFFGVNGVGKTTTIAKFAYMLKKNGIIPIIAASDTFRAAAQEQLAYHASKLEVPIVRGKYGSDPAAVALDAISSAKSRGYHVVLVDTAGRMHVDADLVEELRKIVRVTKPNLRLLVLDALAGNDALEQARTFEEKVGFDGIVLTKVDADAKGGAVLSVAYELNKPVLFLGIGQGYDELIPFNPEWFTKRLFE